MSSHGPLIASLASVLIAALVLGVVAVRLRLPALVGYLAAGILLGPATPGFSADLAIAEELAELGIVLLMFGVGLHFSPGELLRVRRLVLPGALLQMAITTSVGFLLTRAWGWTAGEGLVFGFSLSVASTVVLLRALASRGALRSPQGHIAGAWLVVEDITTVLVLVLLPTLSPLLGGDAAADGAPPLVEALALTLAKLTLYVIVVATLGRRAIAWVLLRVERLASRELFTLAVLALAVGVAFVSSLLFHVSLALGAFFAGVVVDVKSGAGGRAARRAVPFQDAFAVLFFVSVGMLFDPRILVTSALKVVEVVIVVVVGKAAVAFCVARFFRQPVSTALTVGASLAQIGEFSFVLAALGVSMGLLSEEGRGLLLAASLVSIVLNPLLFFLADAAGRVATHEKLPAPAPA